jgi:hypothetical protein
MKIINKTAYNTETLRRLFRAAMYEVKKHDATDWTKAKELRCNAYGRVKAEKFRKRFSLTSITGDMVYDDVHDYLHTVAGTLPIWGDDEFKVLELEQRVRSGKLALRGLTQLDRRQ